MFICLPDSPQGVGDIVGSGCRLVRGNMKLIFNFLLVPTIFATVAGVAFQWIFTYGIANVSQTKDPGTAFLLAAVWFVGFVVLVIAWWILGLRLLALTRLALGFSPTLEEAKANLYRKKWAMLGVYFFGVLLLTAAVCAFAVVAFFGVLLSGNQPSLPAALAFVVFAVGVFATVGIYLIGSHLSLCILACEEEGVVSVIGRALSLVFRHFWRSLAFGLVFTLTITVISYPLSLPVAILTLIDFTQHGLTSTGGAALADSYKPPLYLLVVAQTWESVMGMYLRPLVVFAFGLFYYDMRLRSEGLDIKRRLEKALPDPGLLLETEL